MSSENLLFNLSDSLVEKIYKVTLTYHYTHQSSIGDQLRRASLSVVLNIVEGGAKLTLKERRQYLRTAYSSLKESKYLLYFSNKMNLIPKEKYEEIMKEVNRLASLLYGLLFKQKS